MNLKQFIDEVVKDITDKPRVIARLNICVTCDAFNQEKFKCNHCGCYMKFKSLLPNATCPLNKW